MSNTGIVQSTSLVKDDRGRKTLQVIIHFHDGDTPDINAGTIWDAKPVTVCDASITQQNRNIDAKG